jgi:hypothetical protein
MPGTQGNIQSVQANWDSLVNTLTDRLGAGTGSLLHKARPTQLANGILTIAFDPSAKIQKDMCENNGRSEQITQVLKDCLNLDLKIAFVLDTPSADTPIPIQEDPGAARKRRNDILNDPAVKTVLMELNATVTSIEENQA